MPSMKYKPDAMSPVEMTNEAVYPKIYIPVSPAMAKSVDIGSEVELHIKGFVRGLTAGEDRSEVQVELRESDLYPTKEEKDKEPGEKEAVAFREMVNEEME